MHFDLKRPCASCPFRQDVPGFLTGARVEEIDAALVRATFTCHKTLDYDHDDEDDEGVSTGRTTKDSQHCAGALILLEKLERPSQMMRIAERLRLYDRRRLDMAAPVFDTFEDMRDHHAAATR